MNIIQATDARYQVAARFSAGLVVCLLVIGSGAQVAGAEESTGASADAPTPLTDYATRQLFGSTKALKLAQMASELSNLEKTVADLEKQLGGEHPKVLAAKQQVESLKQSMSSISKSLMLFTDGDQAAAKSAAQVDWAKQIEAHAKQLDGYAEQLNARERQLAQLAAQLKNAEQQQNLPPIEGEVKIFRLAHVPATDAAQQIMSLFGAQAVRVAIDERSNSLIVFGKADPVKSIEAILMQLDAKNRGEAGSGSMEGESGSRSFLMLVFWLADGLPKGEGAEPELYLPGSVILATKRLGLDQPRLVAQTVNSLASRGEQPVQFTTHVPAIVFGQQAQLECIGSMRLTGDDRTDVNLQVGVQGSVNCDLSGSLVSPIGHFMVLGTANSIASDMGIAPDMGDGMGAMGRGGRGEYGGRGGVSDASTPIYPAPAESKEKPGEEGLDDFAKQEKRNATPQFKSSRFAFVVEVIEAESFEPGSYDVFDAKEKK